MSWFKDLFGGRICDREYEQLFLQVLQGVAANWDE
jgi:hypothetical protein